MARRLIIKKKKKTADTRGTEGKQQVKSFGRTAVIGLFGGLFWSLIGMVCQLLNFTKYGPDLLLAPIPLPSWKTGVGGQFLAVVGLTLLSLPIALLYQLTLGRFKNFWISLIFGVVLWGLVFFALQPLIPGLPFLTQLGWNTATTTFCLFLLYGLFIGYSISFEIEEGKQSSGSYSNE